MSFNRLQKLTINTYKCDITVFCGSVSFLYREMIFYILHKFKGILDFVVRTFKLVKNGALKLSK